MFRKGWVFQNSLQLIVTETDGLSVKTVHSEVRGETMEQCFAYTKKLHNGEVKSKNA
jgi:hypothetical protein